MSHLPEGAIMDVRGEGLFDSDRLVELVKDHKAKYGVKPWGMLARREQHDQFRAMPHPMPQPEESVVQLTMHGI